ncbi:dihydrolipoamide acetyltransferase family protein [Marinactinospora endophytica]
MSQGPFREFALPDLGEGLTEAEIVRWLVAVGDTVTVDQPVVEVETAKAVVEVPCPFAGRVSALHGAEGEVIPVGAPLIGVDTGAQGTEGGFDEPGVVVPAARPAAEDASGGSGGSGAVLVGYGTREETRRRGRTRRLDAGGAGRTTASGPRSSPAAPGRTPVVSPLVRRLAREHGLDVGLIEGTGGGGLVLRRDVEAAIVARHAAEVGAAPPRPRRAEGERIALRGAQRTMADRLSRSRREIPEATVWVDADASALLALRDDLNAADPDRPVGVLGLVARFCVLGLARFPSLNAHFDGERGELVRFSHVALGFAAQTPRGLVVPVVPDAHLLSARELSAAVRERTAAARSGTLTPGLLTGGTFTVNNYGVFGVDGSAAIINHPEVAILGMGRIVKRPWVSGDELVARPVVELTLAFDHRACDGAEAGGFLRFVADCVERPQLLLGDL